MTKLGSRIDTRTSTWRGGVYDSFRYHINIYIYIYTLIILLGAAWSSLVRREMVYTTFLPNGPLTRYFKLRIAHTPGMPGAFSPPPTSKETASWRSRHASRHVRHARAVMHVGIANPRWRGKRSRHSRRMRNPQFQVSGKRPMLPTFPCIVFHLDNFMKNLWYVNFHNVTVRQTDRQNKRQTDGQTTQQGCTHNLHRWRG